MDSDTFTQRLCQRTGITTDQANSLQEALARLITQQAGERNTISLQGFGQFALKERPPRQMYNPATGEFRPVPASHTLGFRPSKALKTTPQA